ncbi:hypothetical protein DES38_1139 [Streptohalobacillus salinus]|uniref:Carbohydrate deacetylase n=1 Tax=Streptohalobacillus salinus TaxID=621096 RepID=A0A2V3W5A1_9BACI|nr:chitin disaccharide deacetylase [Streptohalobacillus salinus]PXW88278.1 hypothetical protein DES38_1139 [Streptohalobacillus salinus]
MKVIVNADDFGLTEGVNEGIIDAHLNGVVTRTTLMMNGHAVYHAVRLAKETPTLKVGIHLVLSFGRPLNKTATSHLTKADGTFKFTNLESRLTPEEMSEVKAEWETQINAFLQMGLTLDHIDSHHHVHGWQDLKDVILELSKTYNVPVRYVATLKKHPEHLLTDYLWLKFYKEGVSTELFDDLKALPYPSVEVMVHPANIDEHLRTLSSYVDMRQEEKKALINIVPDATMILI